MSLPLEPGAIPAHQPLPQSRSPPLEQLHSFSRASVGQRALAACLGAVNLLGAVAVGQIARRGGDSASSALAAKVKVPASAECVVPSDGLLLHQAFPLLLAYALVYTGTPALRALRNIALNASVERRNRARLAW